MIAVAPVDAERDTIQVTPWILIVLTDPRKRRSARREFEQAGFEVQVATSIEDAIEFLAVMTPALIVLDENLTGRLPGPGDFLNRPRTIRVEASSDRDVVSEQLAGDSQRDRGELFGQP